MPDVYVVPPPAARRITANVLALRKRLPKSRRGGFSPTRAGQEGIGSGVKRAIDIAAGRRVNAMQVHLFFSRWARRIADELAAGKSTDESKIIQAGDLWGGFPMWEAARVALASASQLNPSNIVSRMPAHVLRALHERDLHAMRRSA
jgi:hypothetical protein